MVSERERNEFVPEVPKVRPKSGKVLTFLKYFYRKSSLGGWQSWIIIQMEIVSHWLVTYYSSHSISLQDTYHYHIYYTDIYNIFLNIFR